MLRAWVCVLVGVLSALSVAGVVQAQPVRVLVVTGKGVSDDAQDAIAAGVSTAGEAVDASEYQRLARAQGELPTSEAALVRIAPRLQAQLIIVAHKAGSKLVVVYRDGASGEVLEKDSLPERHRGTAAAAARFEARLTRSVRKRVAALGGQRGHAAATAQLPAAAETEPDEPSAAELDAQDEEGEEEGEPEPDDDSEPEETAAPAERAPFLFEVSAGVGGATRQSTLPTRLGVHELDTGLYPGVALGLRVGTAFGEHVLLQASVDYRTSLGLEGAEAQRQPAMKTPLRAHAVGFGIAPGYRFGGPNSVSVLLHLGWYFRGLRPIGQLALPEVSWHAALIRPELHVPLADGAVTLRVAPELLVIAGLYTTLPDQSGIARTGIGFGGELAIDVRATAWLVVRAEYRESHARFSTAWDQSVSDIERFAALRLVFRY
jgi:hypothetical protein